MRPGDRRLRAGAAPAAAALLTLVALAGPALAAPRVALRCGALIDGRSPTPRSHVAVLVEGERIAAVGDFDDLDTAGAEVIDLSSATCLPGLVDAHTHILIETEDYQVDHLKRSSGYKALAGLDVAQKLLAAGWTTLRVLGDADVHYADFDIRRAIDEGRFVGPRITGAGHYLSITGGGGDVNFLGPEVAVVADGRVVDGVDAVRRAVREEVKYGSDWIKVLASGAMMSAGDDPTRAHYSPEELAALVGEADRLGVPVAAHAHSAAGIRQAVEAGVRSIEHGTFLDDAGVALMAERGTWLVPTLFVMEPGVMDEHPSEKDLATARRLKAIRPERYARLRRAIDAGVRLGVGTDYVGFPPEQGAREFALLAEVGMTPMQAIQAGTRGNAELLGWEDRIGTVEAGKYADLVAVAGDPLADLSELERVTFVMKGGTVVRASARSGERKQSMGKVLGIGGIFFRSQDPKALGAWYKQWLGIPVEHPHGAMLPIADAPADAFSVFTPFPADTKYFAADKSFMFNLMVDDLDAVLARARDGGAEIVGDVEEYEYGRFGWFLDPDGNKVELWQPPAGAPASEED